MTDAVAKIDWLLGTFWFRCAFAALLVAMHVLDARSMARERFDQDFNRAPDDAPLFTDPLHQVHAQHAKRLAVARWDAEHYEALAMRGYTACPEGPLSDVDIKKLDGRCTLTFYPGYPMIGRELVRLHDMPIDGALWYVSLVATFLTFFLWTSPIIVERFGRTTAWFSLIILNAYPASCYLVFVATEPCALFFTFASYVAFAKRRYLVAALLMGAGSGIRVTVVAGSIALCVGLLVETLRDPPRNALGWITRALCFPLTAWGALATMWFFRSRFGDPMIYAHAHEVIYSHHPALSQLLDPKPGWIMHSIDGAVHDSVWSIGMLLWYVIAARFAFKRLPIAERWFLHALVLAVYALTIYGSLEIYLGGMSRYVMIAFPLFFSVGAFLRTRPFALLLWLSLSRWHYREADLCYYVGDVGPNGLSKCNMTQWMSW